MEAAHASIRRARPLLGTFVEIAVAGAAISAMEAAVEAAFAAVAAVHRLMSFHEATSDVSRLNRDAWSGAIPVHGWTYQVIETALDLNRRSDGMFDVAVAPALQDMGLLPRGPDLSSASPSPRLRGEGQGEGAFPQAQTRGEAPSPGAQARADLSPQAGRGEGCGEFRLPFGEVIQLLPENQVRFAHRGVDIDLGGIAKGFAVDRAIEALRHHGIAEGLVNAGGDLAAFGPRRHPVDIRDPRHPDRPMCHVVLSNAALASSAGRYDPSRSDRASSSAIVDPLTGRPSHTIRGATVCAPCCVIADALTKVVMNAGEGAAALLEHYGASALFVSAQGRVHVTTDWKNEVRFAA
jgi:thiamine biosynthesis lipoprotein